MLFTCIDTDGYQWRVMILTSYKIGGLGIDLDLICYVILTMHMNTWK